MKRCLVCFVAITLIHVFAAQPVFAETPQYFSKYHSDYGSRLYKEGKLDLAVEQFVKSLLADSANRVAKETLKDILKNQDNKLKQDRLTLFRFVEMIDYSEFLKSRIEHLTESNDLLTRFILEHGDFDESLLDTAKTIKVEIDDRAKSFDVEPGIIRPDEMGDDMKLTRMNKMFDQQKVRLTEELNYLQNINNQVRSIKIEVVNNLRELRKQELIDHFENQIDSIENKLADRDSKLHEQNKELASVNVDLQSVQGEFKDLQNKFDATEEKVAGLTKDLADMAMQAYEKDQQLANKEERLRSVETELMDSHEKMNLVQRIIQEKDDQLLSMEEEVIELHNSIKEDREPEYKHNYTFGKNASTQNLKKNTEKMVLLERQFDVLNKKYINLADRLELQDGQLSQLRRNIQLKNDKIVKFKREKDREVFLLRKTIADKNADIAHLNRNVYSRDEQLLQLSNIVDIYKTKLQKTMAVLAEKSDKLEHLEQQFLELTNKFNLMLDDEDQEKTEKQPTAPDEQELSLNLKHLDNLTKEDILENTKGQIDTIQKQVQ